MSATTWHFAQIWEISHNDNQLNPCILLSPLICMLRTELLSYVHTIVYVGEQADLVLFYWTNSVSCRLVSSQRVLLFPHTKIKCALLCETKAEIYRSGFNLTHSIHQNHWSPLQPIQATFETRSTSVWNQILDPILVRHSERKESHECTHVFWQDRTSPFRQCAPNLFRREEWISVKAFVLRQSLYWSRSRHLVCDELFLSDNTEISLDADAFVSSLGECIDGSSEFFYVLARSCFQVWVLFGVL